MGRTVFAVKAKLRAVLGGFETTAGAEYWIRDLRTSLIPDSHGIPDTHGQAGKRTVADPGEGRKTHTRPRTHEGWQIYGVAWRWPVLIFGSADDGEPSLRQRSSRR